MKQANIQYHGDPRTTQSCIDAVARLLQSNERVDSALLLTSDQHHAFLITISEYQKIIIQAAFASGYGGEGPKGLSRVLQLLRFHKIEIDEVLLPHKIFSKISTCNLTAADLSQIESFNRIRPMRIFDYIYDIGELTNRQFLETYSSLIPWVCVDERLLDLAIRLDQGEENILILAFCRLEDILKKRCGMQGTSLVEVVNKAFKGASPYLEWKGIKSGERDARVTLFFSIFTAYRNKYAHQEIRYCRNTLIREFMMINELFLLEAEAVKTEL